MGKIVINCAAGRHVKHRVYFLLTLKMFKSHFHFQNTIKPPSRMMVLLPLQHLSPSHPPSFWKPIPTQIPLYLKLYCAPLPLLQESNVVFRLITSSSSHFVDHCQQNKIKSQNFYFMFISEMACQPEIGLALCNVVTFISIAIKNGEIIKPNTFC